MSIRKYDQQTAAQRKVAFEAYQNGIRVRTDNACRLTMLYCILRQYLKHLSCHGTPNTVLSPLMQAETAIQQLQENKPNFLSAADYGRLLADLSDAMQCPAGNVREKIKRSFLVELPQILVEDQTAFPDAELIQGDIETNDIYSDELPNSITLDQVQLDEKTYVVVDGYYEQVAAVMKTCCSADWFKLL